MLGWCIGNQQLLTIRPGLSAMSPLTTVAFALAGTSLVMRMTHRTHTADAAGPLLVAFNVASLTGYGLAGRDLLSPLIGACLTTASGIIVGTTAPATASGLLLLGTSLLCLERNERLCSQFLAWSSLGGLLVSGLALLGYTYGVEGLYAVASDRTTAVQTAAGLIQGCT